MHLTKRVLILLLLAAAITAGVLYSLRRGPRAAPADTFPDLIALAPPNSTYFFYADLAALRSAAFLAQLSAMVPSPTADRDYAEFVRATGFDYTKDLDRVLLAARPGPSGNLTIALVEGRFDREKITSYILRSGKLEQQNGVNVYVVPSEKPSKFVALAFLGANRIALADGPSLEPVLGPHPPGGLDPAMREHLARVAGSAFFAVGQVGRVPEDFSLGGMRSDQFTNLVRSLRWITLAARTEGDHLRLAVEGECDTLESARQLAGTLDALRVLGQGLLADPKTRQRLGPDDVSRLETLLGAVGVSRDEQRVRVLLELTPEMIRAMTPKKAAPNTASP